MWNNNYIWTGFGSGWVIDKIEKIHIDIANYDSLVGSSYFPLSSELNNSVKGLINIKNRILNVSNGAILGLSIL